MAFGASTWLISTFETGFQQNLAREYPDIPEAQRAALSIARLCGDAQAREALDEDSCEMYGRITLMRAGSLATATGGLAWIGLIVIGGRLSRGKPDVIMRLFRPGVYVTNVLVILLIALHGVLAVAAFALAEMALFGALHIYPDRDRTGALVSAISVGRASFGLVQAVEPHLVGRDLSRERAPALWSFVAQVSDAVGVQSPDSIVVGLEPNFFVSEMPVTSLDGEHTGRTMCLSLPFLRLLTRAELRSVIGHELSHFKGEDTVRGRQFYPVFRGTVDALHALYAGERGVARIATLPAFAILSYLLESFAVALNETSACCSSRARRSRTWRRRSWSCQPRNPSRTSWPISKRSDRPTRPTHIRLSRIVSATSESRWRV